MEGPLREAAREDAALEMAKHARRLARRHGQPSEDQITDLHDNRVVRQARALLLQAAEHLYGSGTAPEVKILRAIRSINHANCDRHEMLAEMWEIIEDAAREEAKSEWELSYD